MKNFSLADSISLPIDTKYFDILSVTEPAAT